MADRWEPPPPPGAPDQDDGWGAVGDVVVSNIVGPIRTFLENCGARFDHHPPLGQRPGGQPVWRLASGQDTAALPGSTA